MRISRAVLFGLAGISVSVLLAFGQDSSSLGDAARQARQQKSKESQKDSAKTPKVITNEEIPEHSAPAASSQGSRGQLQNTNYSPSAGGKISAEQFKSQIQQQKSLVGSLQSDIDKLNDSIHYAPANCVANCVQWNERQKEKQERAEQMKAQLEDQKKRLEDMQESARKQGYGSSVYDP